MIGQHWILGWSETIRSLALISKRRGCSYGQQHRPAVGRKFEALRRHQSPAPSCLPHPFDVSPLRTGVMSVAVAAETRSMVKPRITSYKNDIFATQLGWGTRRLLVEISSHANVTRESGFVLFHLKPKAQAEAANLSQPYPKSAGPASVLSITSHTPLLRSHQT